VKTFKFGDMKGGWFVGDFEPTSLRTAACDVSVKRHSKDEYWAPHLHKVVTEVNMVVSGHLTIQGQTFGPDDIFVMEPMDVADPVFLEDCVIVVVKVPSVPSDKVEVAK
jgi:hypothetical protein